MMQPLAFKVLFRKKGTASAIIAIVLLVALVTAVNCLVNNINSQTLVLSKLAGLGETYLVTDKDSSSLSDSQVDSAVINQIKNSSDVRYATSQRVIQATLSVNGGNFTVTVRGIDDPAAFFSNHKAGINGSISQEISEINIGIVLAKLVSVDKTNQVNIIIDGNTACFTVAGIVQSKQQTDAEITLPLVTLNKIAPANSVSLIEFSLKDPAQANTAITNLTQTLPANTKITSTQQITSFAQDINNQTVVFINLWSVAIYAVVAAASYVIAARAVNEAAYELCMLRTLGAKRRLAFSLILVYALAVGCVGCLVGLSVGIVGTQAASTFVRWIWGSSLLAPFLEVNQAFGILLLASGASLVGSIYPAVRGSCNNVGADTT